MKFRKLKRTLSNVSNWNFERIDVILMQRKLEKSNFYEDVVFANDTVKERGQKNVAKWMVNLKRYKQIEIKRFIDLFSNLEEIKFPIKIKKSSKYELNLYIIDSLENKYHISSNGIFDYYNITKYFIGSINTKPELSIYRNFCYEISEEGIINLEKITIAKLDKYDLYYEIIYDYRYKNKTEEITVCSYEQDSQITVKYPMSSIEVNNEIFQYFLNNIERNWYYYDVFPIFKWLISKITGDDVSIYIVAEIGNEVFSEVEVVNGIVHKYTFTRVVNEGEVHVVKKVFAKKLEEFLKDDIKM